jgi:hypothetical protein
VLLIAGFGLHGFMWTAVGWVVATIRATLTGTPWVAVEWALISALLVGIAAIPGFFPHRSVGAERSFNLNKCPDGISTGSQNARWRTRSFPEDGGKEGRGKKSVSVVRNSGLPLRLAVVHLDEPHGRGIFYRSRGSVILRP